MNTIFSRADISAVILNTMDALVIVLDHQGRIMGFNHACEKLTGYQFEEVSGKEFSELFLLPEEKSIVMRVISELNSGKFPIQYKNHWRTRTGDIRWTEWNNSALLNEDGGVAYVISIGNDTTEQEKVKDELQKLYVEMGKRVHERTLFLEETNKSLASNIDRLVEIGSELRTNIIHSLPHEFLTPLSVILGFSDLLLIKSAELTPQQVHQFAQDIHHSAGRLLRMIKNFLFYSELEVILSDPGKVAMQRKAQLTVIPEEVGRFAALKLAEVNRESRLRWVLQQGTLAISETHFHKLLEEILDNAAKYSSPETVIELSGRVIPSQKKYRFSVTDYGRGMTEMQIQAVAGFMQFDRFVYEQQGIGMGLIISRRIVDIYGGSLEFSSKPGYQTRVEFDIPLA